MNNKKIKILILGIGQSNFLDQLYGGVQKETKKFQFSIDGYSNFSEGVNESSQIYTNYYDFKNISISKNQKLRALLSFAKKKLFYEVIFFELSQKSTYKKIRKQILKLAISKYKAEHIVANKNYAIYHFHFCTPHNLMLAYFLPNNAKIICSFWGSDLMRTTGVSNVYYVQKALKKATKITVQTPEMAEMLYCKYGRNFMAKTESLRFTIDEKIFQEIDVLSKDEDSEFRKKYAIPLNKTVIAIGNNAFKENNHLRIIDSLQILPDRILKKCVFLLHLSYGGNKAYIDNLIQVGKSHDKMDFIIIKEFFGPKKIALLRNCTSILIQMPISDALSGAMTEVLYAGNQVIAGSWLPYGFFRRSKIAFYEVDNFLELPNVVAVMVQENEKLKINKNLNKENIRNYFFPSQTTPDWINLFETVSNYNK